ncbi:MAG: hypothetical protein DMG96_06480 [Acidobacteria bacterium]|nr:MAG: hypothetical protein DMG96_06480 [Acidobacteriota bacterium]
MYLQAMRSASTNSNKIGYDKDRCAPSEWPNHRKPSNRLEDSEITSDANGALKEFGADGKGEVGTV